MSPSAVLTDGALHVEPLLLDIHAAVIAASTRRAAEEAQQAVEAPPWSPGSFEADAKLLMVTAAPTLAEDVTFV